MTNDEIRQKYLDLFATVEPDHAMDMIISNMMDEARDLGERMPAGPERMTRMQIIKNYWRGMMREAGLKVVRE